MTPERPDLNPIENLWQENKDFMRTKQRWWPELNSFVVVSPQKSVDVTSGTSGRALSLESTKEEGPSNANLLTFGTITTLQHLLA